MFVYPPLFFIIQCNLKLQSFSSGSLSLHFRDTVHDVNMSCDRVALLSADQEVDILTRELQR